SLPAVLSLLQLIGGASFEIIVMSDAASLQGAKALADGSLWAHPQLWTMLFGPHATQLTVSGPMTFEPPIFRKSRNSILKAACSW
ncbi:putative hydroxymethylpyrimidine transporter CytX, partial [Pseudomonas syringae pv. tagetis]